MIEPTTTTVVRATAEPARDKSAEQTSNDDFQETLDRASAIEPTQAVPAPDERKIEPEPRAMRPNDAPRGGKPLPTSAAAQAAPANAGPVQAPSPEAAPSDIRPSGPSIAPAKPDAAVPATAPAGAESPAGDPRTGTPTPVDPRAAQPNPQQPTRPPLHQTLRPIAPGEALDPATRASVELTAAAPTRAMTAAALARAAADRPAAAPEAPTGESLTAEGGGAADEPSSSGRGDRPGRFSTAGSTYNGPADHAASARRQPPHPPEQPPAASAQSAPHRTHEQPAPPTLHAPAAFQAASITPTSRAANAAHHAASVVSAAAASSKSQPSATTAARIGLTPIAAKATTAQAPRTAIAPPPPAEPPAAQFARGLAAALRQNGGTVTLHLKPQELGELTIRMQISQGSVEARFEAATDQARGLLNESIDTLRAALEAKGLGVDRLSVHVAERHAEHAAQDAPPRDSGDSGPGHGRHQGHGSPRGAARMPHSDPGEEPPEIPHAWAEPHAGLGGAPRLDAIA